MNFEKYIITQKLNKDYEFFYEGYELMIEPLNEKAFKTLKSFDKTILRNLDCYFMVLNEACFWFEMGLMISKNTK
tara:strand:+ start:392 stop:616 length:225 start_codon:yes stop_codon:yes gene_type:complete